jgi:hypothetical protein
MTLGRRWGILLLVLLTGGVSVFYLSRFVDSFADSSVPNSRGAALKEKPEGLYLTSKRAHPETPFIDHMTISGDWSEFEPGDQVFKGPGWKRIKKKLRKYPELKFRLRIHAGRGAPAWVKHLGGPPSSGDGINCDEAGGIAIRQPSNKIGSCVPYFWTDSVLDEYRELMAEVARRYDRNTRILDVVNSACTTNWAEPFIRAGDDVGSNTRLWNAGLNEATDRACFERSMAIHINLFHRTRVSLATHKQWQIIVDPATDSDGVRPSWDHERLLLDQLRSLYGEKLIIQHNGLDENDACAAGTPPSEDLLCWMNSAPPPLGFQTEGDKKLQQDGATVYDAVTKGIALGACFIEHHDFGSSPELAGALDQQLKTNCD